MSISADQAERYLGDSTTARVERCKGAGGVGSFIIHLFREHSGGGREEIRMDPLLLAEFPDWLEDNGLVRDPWGRPGRPGFSEGGGCP